MGLLQLDTAQLWAEIAQAALNFIVVNGLTASAQVKTVTDMKTDLRTTKEDLIAELKETKEEILGIIHAEAGNNDKE